MSSATAWWIGIASAAVVFAALVAVPLLVVRIPADYFAHSHRASTEWPRRCSWLRLPGLIVKNVVGCAFFVLGALMLVLPGQSSLTLLIAIALLDFPGKLRLQRWVVTHRGVIDSINWIRRKAGKGPLVLDR